MDRSIYSQKYNKLRDWLKNKRVEQKLTIRQLAARLDVHYSIVGKVEQGYRKLDIIEFLDYCEALNADPEEAIRLVKKDR